MTDADDQMTEIVPEPVEHPEVIEPAIVAPDEEHAEPRGAVTEPAKVMRIGSMVKQLLEEVRQAPLDDASRERLAEIYERSVTELADALSPDLQEELRSLALPFDGRGADRRRAADRPGPARRLARRPVPRHPGHAVRPADGGPPAARADAPAAPGRPGGAPGPGGDDDATRPPRHLPVAAFAAPRGAAGKVDEPHRCDSQPCPIRSPISTSTPSSRCSTGRRASTRWWPRRSPTVSRRSA